MIAYQFGWMTLIRCWGTSHLSRAEIRLVPLVLLCTSREINIGKSEFTTSSKPAAFFTRVLFLIFREMTEGATPHIRANSAGITSLIRLINNTKKQKAINYFNFLLTFIKK
jgi:hypothetical protein